MAQTFTENCFAPTNAALTDLQNMENNFLALKTMFSGSSAPADSTGGMPWADTGNKILKIRNSANDAWVSIIDFSTNSTNAGSVYKVQRTVTAGTGLTGGGQLTTDITVSVASSGIDSAQIKTGAVTVDKLSGVAKALGSGSGAVTISSTAYSAGYLVPFVCPTGPSTITAYVCFKADAPTRTANVTLGIYSTASVLTTHTGTTVSHAGEDYRMRPITLAATTLSAGTQYILGVFGNVDADSMTINGVSAYWS
jgi:hypothetical protein